MLWFFWWGKSPTSLFIWSCVSSLSLCEFRIGDSKSLNCKVCGALMYLISSVLIRRMSGQLVFYKNMPQYFLSSQHQPEVVFEPAGPAQWKNNPEIASWCGGFPAPRLPRLYVARCMGLFSPLCLTILSSPLQRGSIPLAAYITACVWDRGKYVRAYACVCVCVCLLVHVC